MNHVVLTRLINIPAHCIDGVLRRVELSDAAEKRVGQHSQGMKQRLGLAMALLNEPEFLILGEPTNGLDPAGIRDVRELLRRLAVESGTTVFLSSHLLSEVEQIATHLGIIHQGRLLFQGTFNELQRTRRAGPWEGGAGKGPANGEPLPPDGPSYTVLDKPRIAAAET